MARQTGGLQVSGAYYWNEAHARERRDERGEALAPRAPSPDPRVPQAAVGDELELLRRYLPSGVALYAYGVARRVRERVAQGALDLAATLQPGQSPPGEAHFTGRPGEDRTDGGARGGASTPELERLELEIAERKRGK